MPEFDEVKDSGERQQWSTGSQRDAQEGKGRWDLIPFLPMERLAQHYENGAKKYDDDNWKKGQNLRQYVNSAMRHLFKMAEGWTDEDHAAAVMWNAAAFIWTKDAIDRGELPAELDDIPWEDRKEPLEREAGSFVLNWWDADGPPAAQKVEHRAGLGDVIRISVETPVYENDGFAMREHVVADFDGPQSTGEGLETHPEGNPYNCPCGGSHGKHNPENDAPK